MPTPSPTAQHARLLHPTGGGLVALARRDDGHGWRETCVTVRDLPAAVGEYTGHTDCYLSVGRFSGRRAVARLLAQNALYADVDYRRSPTAGVVHLDPERALHGYVLPALDAARIPAPSFAVASGGGGLHLYWFHGPIPRAALLRWTACQRIIHDALADLGADRAALDAARVLRLAGTVHGRTGQLVRILHAGGATWAFDDLADEVLPRSRAEIHDLRVQRALRRGAGVYAPAPARQFCGAGLWEARLTDLQHLREMRWNSGCALPAGHRDAWLLWASVAVSWIAPPEAAEREVLALAEECGWDEREARSRLGTVLRRAVDAAAGRRIEWRGQLVDPRYRARRQTLVDWLGVTAEEQRNMHVLIGDAEARRRHRDGEAERRRSSGAVARDEYVGQSLQQTRPWESTGISRATWYRRRCGQE